MTTRSARTGDKRQIALRNLELEVESRKKNMQSLLEHLCATFESRCNAAMLKLPKAVRSMTVDEYENKMTQRQTRSRTGVLKPITNTVGNTRQPPPPQTPRTALGLPETPMRNENASTAPRRITLRSAMKSTVKKTKTVSVDHGADEDEENESFAEANATAILRFPIQNGKTVVTLDVDMASPTAIRNLDPAEKEEIKRKMVEMRKQLDGLLEKF